MPAAVVPSRYDARSPGGRAGALALSAAITALLVLALIRLGFLPPIAKAPPGPTTLTLLPEGVERATPTAKPVAKATHAGGGAPARSPTAKAAPAAAPTPPLPPPPVPPLNIIPLSSAEMAAADISTKPTRAAARAAAGDAGEGRGRGSAAGDAELAGSGPHGEKLYNADWYVRPTYALFASYMPARQQSGWGEIACRTVPQYRVEDCQQLDESPGSGLSRTLLQAAWQLRVLPPRLGGKPLIGAWVRIRYTFELHEAS